MSAGPKLAEVVTLYEGNVANVAAMARRFADDVEAGEYGPNPVAICTAQTASGVAVLGWGEIGDATRSLGLLTAGTAYLSRYVLNGGDA